MTEIFTSSTRILCVGVNYADHAAEGKMEPPKFPNFFVRYPSSFVRHGEALQMPKLSTKYDFEGELVAVIGKAGRFISRDAALDYVSGYAIGMDGSVRDYQKRTSQFTLGKNFDRSGAIGPAIVPASNIPPGAKGLSLKTRVNGAIMQDASTSDMIFDVAAVVSTLSEAMTLQPGDLILTGTPSGVGFARTPPIFLKPGDEVEIEIEKIGVLRNKVVA
jgi:2-keto-4-pentenoate hydratase/2-oxohepta-3-ene-1,7-dioic acid hydratase in catechol pathway